MSDNTTSPADKDKIADILEIIAAKGDEQKAALIELADQTRQTKTVLSDVMAQRTEFAAHVKDLKASIDTTRRALDPKALAKNVADNNTAFMGDITQRFGHALDINAARDRQLQNTAQDLEAQTKAFSTTNANLRFIADSLEERDKRSKWDWATLAAGMLISAGLAGGGAFYFAKASIEQDSFTQAVARIAQDTDAGWCDIANGQIVSANDGSKHCAIAMPNYVEPEQAE